VLLRAGQRGMCESIPDTSIHPLYISPPTYQLSSLKGTPKADRLFPRGSVKFTRTCDTWPSVTSGYPSNNNTEASPSHCDRDDGRPLLCELCNRHARNNVFSSRIIIRKNPQNFEGGMRQSLYLYWDIMHHDICQRWRTSHLWIAPLSWPPTGFHPKGWHVTAALGHHQWTCELSTRKVCCAGLTFHFPRLAYRF
jgi:hypothetical protein